MNGNASGSSESTPLVYYYLYKPFGILSQFSAEGNTPGLSSILSVPADVYPVGRLDADSEGLLFLTNDTRVNHQLLDPKWGHWRTYWVQVEGVITPEALKKLQQGVEIRIQKKLHATLPAKAELLQEPVVVPERNPPIRFRQNIPTSWISLSLREGKNRQVRRMTAAVGFPTLRLIRIAIEDMSLESMQPGDLREISRLDVYKQLKIESKNSDRSDGARRERFSRSSGRRF